MIAQERIKGVSYINNQITNFSPIGEEGEVVEVAAALALYKWLTFYSE